jgi:hypothetical protein
MPVDPVRGVRVPTDLEVFAQLLVADSATLGEQLLDLFEDKRVALDHGSGSAERKLFVPNTFENSKDG